ncbi:MAG: LptE family protein [bacterium]|nr:LptE family protein [bacterium]
MIRLVLCIPLAVLFSCYSFRGQVAGDTKSIAIPSLSNESTEFGLAETVTDALIRAFQRDGTLKVVPEGQADATLTGSLVDVRDEPYTARSDGGITVDEYRFSMTCRMELIDRETGESKWTQNFPVFMIYTYGGDLSNRDSAVTAATEKLVTDLINKIVGSW